MADIKETLKEAKAIITYLKAEAKKATAINTADEAKIDKRIAHLNDKSQDATETPKKLDIDLSELDNLDTIIGQDKTTWALEKSQLEKAKKDAEKETTDKNDLLVKKQEECDKIKTEIADKITADLITKLENVAKSTPADQTQKLTDIKSVIDEIKTKGAKADLTDISSKVDALTNTANSIKETQGKGGGEGSKTTQYSAIAAAVLAGLALIISIYGAFFKPNGNTIIREDKNE